MWTAWISMRPDGETEDGRVMVGWLQSQDNYMTPEDFLWSGMIFQENWKYGKEG